jgi:hypothetical protein
MHSTILRTIHGATLASTLVLGATACPTDDPEPVSGDDTTGEPDDDEDDASTSSGPDTTSTTTVSTTAPSDDSSSSGPEDDSSSGDDAASSSSSSEGEGEASSTGEPVETCADDPCHADATCSDGAGGPTCVCNAGYEGDGFDCADIDECDEGTAGCDPNASCTNEDGGFECECNPGWDGNGFSCSGTATYGEPCEEGNECASGLCILAPYDHCSELCDQDVANDCPNVGAAGFCVPIGMGDFACVGDLDTGFDDDAEILSSGDSATRNLDTVSDVDLFHVDLPAGSFVIAVEPDPDDDVQVDFHDGVGQTIGIVNDGGDGFIEGAVLDTSGGVSFVVVRNAGGSTGQYTISVEPE